MIITFVSNEGSRRNVSCIAMRPHFSPHAHTPTCIHIDTDATHKWLIAEDNFRVSKHRGKVMKTQQQPTPISHINIAI